MSVHKYNLKFTKLYLYNPEMVEDMRNMMSLFVYRLSRLSSKKGKTIMLIGDMYIARLTIHLQWDEKDKLKDREEFLNNRANTKSNESGQQETINRNHSKF
ncbi:hypothetical protein H5410_021775 [Solanum commersonii]|uniref:Uncharacterized protein n=1 Tax=Solanum commersonii TaxID=4109 RepID=A0A9J5ZI45_SOLCO|nr:hypothetical protein H5410_021775 [Solanum commersonii]